MIVISFHHDFETSILIEKESTIAGVTRTPFFLFFEFERLLRFPLKIATDNLQFPKVGCAKIDGFHSYEFLPHK